MKKKMIFSVMIVMMMVAAAGMPLMAAGAQEGADDFARPYQQYEEKTLTGEVSIGTDGRASLTVDGQEYELLYPYIAAVDLEVETGDVVTVEGAVVPGPRWEENEDVQYLHVTKAVIDGEEFDLEAAYGYGPNGRRSAAGPMGGQGQTMNGRPMMGPQGKFGGPAPGAVARGGASAYGYNQGYGAQPNAYGPYNGYGVPGQMQGGPGMRRF